MHYKYILPTVFLGCSPPTSYKSMDGSVRGKSDFYKINRVNEAVCKNNNSEFSDFPSDIFKPMVSRTGHLEHARR